MKNQFKKSLSLIMAVLMLMSCWVWVAPDKANAYLDITYSVTINYDVGNTAKNGGHVEIYYYPFNDDGTLSSTRTKFNDTANQFTGGFFIEGNNTNGCSKTATGIPGWPCEIFWQVNGASADDYNVRITAVKVNNVTVAQSTTWVDDDGTADKTRNFTWKWDGTGSSDSMVSSRNWSKPTFTTLTTIEASEAGTVGKLANGANITTSGKITGGKDQYGADLQEAMFPSKGVSYTLEYNNASGGRSTVGTDYATVSGTGKTATVTLKDDLQKLFPKANGGTIYLIAKYGSTTAEANIKFTNPSYKMTFDANGGQLDVDGGTVTTYTVGGDDSKLYYDTVISTIGKPPATGSKPGKTFIGYYDQKNADATGATANFQGTKYEDGVTKVGDTGDKTWYAAWQSAPINATFVTQDGQLIGTVQGRYDNAMVTAGMYADEKALNTAVKAAYNNRTDKKASITFDGNNAPVYKDGSSTYTFAGWRIIKGYNDSVVDGDETTTLQGDVTFQATYTKADAATYTVSFKNTNGDAITTKSGYKYRDQVTNVPSDANLPTLATDDRYEYEFAGWAKDIGNKYYTVDSENKDQNGATIVYTAKDGAEFIVKGNASYVPVFRMIPREYTVTFNYTADNNTPASVTVEGYHWGDAIEIPDSIKDNYTAGGYRYYIESWSGSKVVEGNTALTAVYGTGIPAEYSINFYGKDVDGETDVLLEEGTDIYEHGDKVTAPTVAQTIDTVDALYTFAGWSPEINTTASGDADYYATYTKQTYADVYFYNYDGTPLYDIKGNKENTQFIDSVIPAYPGMEDPVKEADPIGTYIFTGWKDADGNVVVPGTDKFTGDTYLYAQFETVYNEYTVKFVNEGETVSETKYHYGEEITVPANPSKDEDVQYTYDFKAWSPDVSEVCYGDVTYTATYRRTPRYYTVTWLNDAKNIHTESNYKYDTKIQQAVIDAPVSLGSAGDGKTWAFKHWVQCDANGNAILDAAGKQIIFVRGQKMGSEHLYFYPVFEAVANILTVKFYKEDGTTEIGKAQIPYGAFLADYAEPFAESAPKSADEINHYVIENWVNVNGGAAVTTITADVSVKATYTAVPHTKDVYDITLEPTCTETGLADVTCSATECDKVFKNVVLDVIPDEGNPSGQIYVGTDKWTLDDYSSIDYDEIKFVNPKETIVVNAWDNGSRSKNNPDALLSRGVGKIDYYVSETVITDPSTIGNWTNAYDYEAVANQVLNEVLEEKGKTMQDYIAMSTPNNKEKKAIDDEVKAILSTYKANATGALSNLNLVNGKTYIIYIRVSDREVGGQSNKCFFSTGTISYGTKSAEITVSGRGYGAKFCESASVRVVDDADGLEILLDGKEVDAFTNSGTTSANGTFVATFDVTAPGYHTVTVIDKHGNKTEKNLEVKGIHTYRNYTVAASCENDGSRYDLCTVCGNKANEEVITKLGHSYTGNYADKAATCTVDGYRTYVCDNGCGEKLVLKPTDDAETLAQAKKNVSTDLENPVYKDLVADDLKHLKANGVHTYAKAVDADGMDTDEDAWVIDYAATCVAAGSKHKDCTKCGERVIEVIGIDKENGHKFYRAKVTTEPTCTEKGEKTKTCRYCGDVVHVEYVDALGHTEGDYRVITAATCEAAGSQIRTCSVCGKDFGDEAEIPALGHAWKVSGEIYKNAEDGKWYQNYVCKNDASHTKKEVVEGYVPAVPATVKFMNDGAIHATITGNVGDTISASEITAKPTKAANETYTYIFSHWEDAEGKEVKFPIEVKGDATYHAVYTEKYVNYTITYHYEDGATEFKKTGYLHNGEEVILADGPSKAETKLDKYEFAGWVEMNDTSETPVVYTDKITINAADINLKATYKEVDKYYAVTYAYSSSNQLHTYVVKAGTEAPDVAKDLEIKISKSFDTKYHYNFTNWNKAGQLAKVESNIYTTPNFEAVDHSYTITLKTPATCTANRVDTYTCACGYSYDMEIANTARGHNFDDGVYDEATGKNIRTCQNEGCGETTEDTRSFTAKFFVNETDEKAIKTVYYIPWNTTIAATSLPADPAKASDNTNSYEFKGWAVKGTTEPVNFAEYKIKADCEFVAVFEAKARIYSVVFAYDAYNVIKTITDVTAGRTINLETDVDENGKELKFTETPEKVYDANYHYTFSGWQGYEAGKLNIKIENVQSDLYILAEFSKAKHEYTATDLEEATCTNGKGTRYTCTCGKYYDVTGKPLDHNFVEVERKEATANSNGYIKYKCETCTATKEETLKYEDNTMEIKVYVEHNGAAESGVKVEIQNAVDGSVIFATTNANGYATFTVDKSGAYTCFVFGEEVVLAKDGDGYAGTYSYSDQVSCTCACHRDNVWGAIFRFFHKIIKLFTGEFKCCKNPDPMYG